jgi:hypothetical protein
LKPFAGITKAGLAVRVLRYQCTELIHAFAKASDPPCANEVVLVTVVQQHIISVDPISNSALAGHSAYFFCLRSAAHSLRTHFAVGSSGRVQPRLPQWLVPPATLIPLCQPNQQLRPLLGLVCAFFARSLLSCSTFDHQWGSATCAATCAPFSVASQRLDVKVC